MDMPANIPITVLLLLMSMSNFKDGATWVICVIFSKQNILTDIIGVPLYNMVIPDSEVCPYIYIIIYGIPSRQLHYVYQSEPKVHVEEALTCIYDSRQL